MENKYVTINKSAYDFDRMNYKEVVSYLENLGFIYIDTFATSRSGHFFINENEITEISIDGNSKFLKDEQFPLDARITITYYTKSKYLYQLTTMVPGFLHSHLC